MKRIFAVCLGACLILGSLWLYSYAQQGKTEKEETKEASQMQMGPGMMQQMMGRGNSMMEQCRNMMRTLISPDSPNSILALRKELGLSEEQVEKIKAVGEKANAEAKKILSEKQLKQFETLTKEWTPQTMMQGMKKMPPCPMMQMMQEEE
jgi:hypothetical protein